MSSNGKKNLTATQKRKLLSCYKCKKFVKFDENLQCKGCKNKFDLTCANVTVKKFYEMTNFLKAKWTCTDCSNKIQHSKSTTSTPIATSRFPTSEENLEAFLTEEKSPTSENKQISLNESQIYDTNSSMLSIRSELRRSLPDLSTRINEDDILGLKKRNEIIEQKLESAHLEIDNLVLEKNKLLRIISEQEVKINNLLRICSTSTTKSPKKVVLNDSKKERATESVEKFRLKDTIPTIQPDDNNSMEKESINVNNTATNINVKPQKNIFNKDKVELKPTYAGRNIYIFGTQQSKGLALSLLDSRANTRYENYKIKATTKPNASSVEVLKGCYDIVTNKYDKMILCVGENDENPVEMLTNLHSVIRKHCNCSIIVLNIRKNIFLNIDLLNLKLNDLCSNNNNCVFVDVKNLKMSEICYKINLAIDTIDYKQKYLNFKELKKLINTERQSKQRAIVYQPGTIPYYFKKIETHNINCVTVVGDSLKSSQNNYKPGTIPYYFKVMSKKSSNNLNTKNNDQGMNSNCNKKSFRSFLNK